MAAVDAIGMSGGQIVPPGNLSAADLGAVGTPQDAAGAGDVQQISASLSNVSISSNVESLIATSGGSANNNLMAALLLLLTLEYMSGKGSQNKDLMSLLGSLLQQGGGGGGDGSMLMYTSSSLSIESTSLQVVATSTGLDAYSASAPSTSQVPGEDASSAGLDVLA